jgi:hypothetical protein
MPRGSWRPTRNRILISRLAQRTRKRTGHDVKKNRQCVLDMLSKGRSGPRRKEHQSRQDGDACADRHLEHAVAGRRDRRSEARIAQDHDRRRHADNAERRPARGEESKHEHRRGQRGDFPLLVVRNSERYGAADDYAEQAAEQAVEGEPERGADVHLRHQNRGHHRPEALRRMEQFGSGVGEAGGNRRLQGLAQPRPVFAPAAGPICGICQGRLCRRCKAAE